MQAHTGGAWFDARQALIVGPSRLEAFIACTLIICDVRPTEGAATQVLWDTTFIPVVRNQLYGLTCRRTWLTQIQSPSFIINTDHPAAIGTCTLLFISYLGLLEALEHLTDILALLRFLAAGPAKISDLALRTRDARTIATLAYSAVRTLYTVCWAVIECPGRTRTALFFLLFARIRQMNLPLRTGGTLTVLQPVAGRANTNIPIPIRYFIVSTSGTLDWLSFIIRLQVYAPARAQLALHIAVIDDTISSFTNAVTVPIISRVVLFLATTFFRVGPTRHFRIAHARAVTAIILAHRCLCAFTGIVIMLRAIVVVAVGHGSATMRWGEILEDIDVPLIFTHYECMYISAKSYNTGTFLYFVVWYKIVVEQVRQNVLF